MIDVDGRYGGSLLVEALWLDGPLRVGASMGIAALSNAGAERSSAVGVLGPALWLGVPRADGAYGVLRAGGFAGGEKGGLFAGLWIGPSLGYRFALGETAGLSLAAELWVLHEQRTAIVASPAVGLTW